MSSACRRTCCAAWRGHLSTLTTMPGWRIAALDYCGRVNCLEACCFGMCRRRLTAISAIHDLLQKCNPPLYEVRIARGVWVRPFGKLLEASIEAAKQLSRRALDSLHDTKIVAVGAFKVAPAVPPLDDDERWRCEIHQLVAGVKKEDLEQIFSARRDRGEIRSTQGKVLNHLMITEIHELGPTISEVIRQDIRGWRHPWQDELDPARPTKAQRREFYSWLIGLSPDARIFRYGCDQYFRKLEKKPRPIRAKVHKKRPYPYWLQRYLFGSHSRTRWTMSEPRKSLYFDKGEYPTTTVRRVEQDLKCGRTLRNYDNICSMRSRVRNQIRNVAAGDILIFRTVCCSVQERG